jgi:hypothetical protein
MTRRARGAIADASWTLRLAPLYVALALLKHVVPLSTLVRWAWSGSQRPSSDPAARHRAVRAVSRLQRWFGRGRDCLQSSLILYRELSRRGDNPVLCVGFRREGRAVAGHAWVSANGRTVLNETYDQPFVTVIAFGADGRPVTDRERQ